jgi:hypothetical protein
MKICLCASVSAYQELILVKNLLAAEGHVVVAPTLALQMEAGDSFDNLQESAAQEDATPDRKGAIMREHLEKIAKCEAILVINQPKHGIDGYVGPNVLIEMGIAFYFGKQIFLLNTLDTKSTVRDEVFGMGAVELSGRLEHLRAMLHVC